MATHSSVLAWRIPGTAGPGGLLSMGSHRVRHNWSDLAAAAASCFPQRLYKLIFSPTMYKDCLFSTYSATLVFHTFENRRSDVGGDLSLWFWFAFPWWLVMLTIYPYTSWPFVCLFKSFVFVFSLLCCMNSLYILDINPLADTRFAIFSHSIDCLITLLIISSAVQNRW